MRHRFVHLGDYNTGMEKNKYNNINIEKKLDLLLTRLNRIEACLAPSNMIKATPIMSIVAGDVKCLNRISDIYEKWITYKSTVTNLENIEYNIEYLFWNLDYFIFVNYFSKLQTLKDYLFEFVDVDVLIKHNYTPEQSIILNIVLSKTRDDKLKLLYPPRKEFISSIIRGKTVFLVYFENKIYNIVNDVTPTNNTTNNKTDFHFSDAKLHSALSMTNDVVGDVNNSINVSMINNNNLDFSNTNKDKRHHILGNKRPLYNNLVDIITLNKFNSSLYRISPIFLNLSLIPCCM